MSFNKTINDSIRWIPGFINPRIIYLPRPLGLGKYNILGLSRKKCFRYLKLMSPLNAAIYTTTYLERQQCYGPDKKILFKKPLFDLEVKVPRRSLWYVAHRLMVMHPHTKYHWPISKDKQVMVRTSFAEKKRKKRKRKKKSD